MHIPNDDDIARGDHAPEMGFGQLPAVTYQTLLPKDLRRNELAIIQDIYITLCNLGCLDEFIVASVSDTTLSRVGSIIPKAKLMQFDRIDPGNFRGKDHRRFEIIAGKELLRRYAADRPDKLFFFNDADQWISRGTICRALKMMKKHTVVRITVPKRTDRLIITQFTWSFSCYICPGRALSLINLLIARDIAGKQAGRGKPKIGAPDNVLLKAIRKGGFDVVSCPHCHTQHYDFEGMWEMIDTDLFFRYDHWEEGEIRQIQQLEEMP